MPLLSPPLVYNRKEQLNIPGFYPDWAKPTYQTIRVLLLAFVLFVAFLTH